MNCSRIPTYLGQLVGKILRNQNGLSCWMFDFMSFPIGFRMRSPKKKHI